MRARVCVCVYIYIHTYIHTCIHIYIPGVEAPNLRTFEEGCPISAEGASPTTHTSAGRLLLDFLEDEFELLSDEPLLAGPVMYVCVYECMCV